MRVSVTTIDLYRRYLDGLLDFDKLVKWLTIPSPPSEFMRRGTALHNILEKLDYVMQFGEYFVSECGIYYPNEVINYCARCIDYRGIFEIKEVLPYNISGKIVYVSAKADQLIGDYVIENKTKWAYNGYINYDFYEYYNSCQWRFYADMYGVDRVYYNIFIMDINKYKDIELLDIIQFYLTPCINNHEELCLLLGEFVNFVESNKLEYLFPDKELEYGI